MNTRAHSHDETGTRIGGFFLGMSLSALAVIPLVFGYVLAEPGKLVETLLTPLGLFFSSLMIFGIVLMAKAMVGRCSIQTKQAESQ